MQQFSSQDWQTGRIREWLLLLLRFAITCDLKDQAAVFAMADEIDALGHQWRPSAPSFFRRTSGELRGDQRARSSEASRHSQKAHRTDRRSSIAAHLSSCGRP
jgi:hypothetical protein